MAVVFRGRDYTQKFNKAFPDIKSFFSGPGSKARGRQFIYRRCEGTQSNFHASSAIKIEEEDGK